MDERNTMFIYITDGRLPIHSQDYKLASPTIGGPVSANESHLDNLDLTPALPDRPSIRDWIREHGSGRLRSYDRPTLVTACDPFHIQSVPPARVLCMTRLSK